MRARTRLMLDRMRLQIKSTVVLQRERYNRENKLEYGDTQFGTNPEIAKQFRQRWKEEFLHHSNSHKAGQSYFRCKLWETGISYAGAGLELNAIFTACFGLGHSARGISLTNSSTDSFDCSLSKISFEYRFLIRRIEFQNSIWHFAVTVRMIYIVLN